MQSLLVLLHIAPRTLSTNYRKSLAVDSSTTHRLEERLLYLTNTIATPDMRLIASNIFVERMIHGNPISSPGFNDIC
ncbi:hypothetical protein M433DRAFT_282301 [Acidomyces richmondensis BFW]|nr:MAG: hypothetical protein FE78DRAFT_407629 [Acidomyces sp. 'richmondensis']KYG50594.1 hypothetical protein M433DRAFT_282301 [Acidomyces richmondensis BFW]